MLASAKQFCAYTFNICANLNYLSVAYKCQESNLKHMTTFQHNLILKHGPYVRSVIFVETAKNSNVARSSVIATKY